MQASFPQALLDQASTDKACICAACLQKHGDA